MAGEKVLVVGAGGISNVWFPALIEDGVDIVGVVDLNLDAAQAKIDQYELSVQPSTDYEKALRETSPDIVCDLTIPEAHCDITSKALAAGCHVLGEKPLAASMAEARKMVEAAKAAGRTYAVMQNRRYDAHIRRMKHFLDNNRLGPLTTLNADFYLGPHFGGFREEMDHVLLLDMAIHSFDAGRFLCAADPVAVTCYEWNPPGSWYKHGASAVAVFEMSNDAVFTYRGSWCANGLFTTWECDWRAVCVDGTVKWDGAGTFAAQAVKTDGPGFDDVEVPEVDPREKNGAHGGWIKDSLACIRAGKTPETIASDNIKSLAMVFGAIESAETGCRVKIEW